MLRHLEIRAQELSAVLVFGSIVLFGLTTTAFAQMLRDAPDNKVVPPASSVIRGRVTYADSGLPVRRAPVGLAEVSGFVGSPTRFAAIRGGGVDTNYYGLTNDAGEYEVRGIPKGVYYLWVFAPNVLQPNNVISFYDNDTLSGVANFDRFFERVETDGISEVHLDFQARKGGAISGVVTFEDGSPAPGIEVTVFRRSDDPFADGLTSISSTGTDDRGAFRITSLLPGSYLLRYRQRADHTGSGRTTDFPDYMSDSRLVVYSPVHPRSRDAESYLSVALGEEITADKILLKRGLYSISGRVFDRSTFDPVRGIIVRFGRINSVGDTSYDSENRSISSGDGGWSFKDLPAGKYFLKAESTEKGDYPFDQVPAKQYAFTHWRNLSETDFNTISVFGELLHMLCRSGDEIVACMRLHGYFDASGGHGGRDPKGNASPVTVIGGYFASAYQWQEFQKEWAAYLVNDNRQLTHLHTTDLLAGTKNYADWDRQKRDKAIYDAIGLVDRYAQYGVSQAVVNADYEKFVELHPECLPIFISPYYLCAALVFKVGQEFAERIGYKGSIHYVFEYGDAGQADVLRAHTTTSQDKEQAALWHIREGGIAFEPKKAIGGLQVADMLANLVHKEYYRQFYERALEPETRQEFLWLKQVPGAYESVNFAVLEDMWKQTKAALGQP